MGTASYVGDVESRAGANQRLYRVSPPMPWSKWNFDGDEPVEHRYQTSYVVVSGAFIPGEGPETYIFPADSNGKILNMGELPGSFRGSIDHAKALRNAGYTLGYVPPSSVNRTSSRQRSRRCRSARTGRFKRC